MSTGDTRRATVRATEECMTWALDRDTFRKIMMQSGKSTMSERVTFLNKVRAVSREHALAHTSHTLKRVLSTLKRDLSTHKHTHPQQGACDSVSHLTSHIYTLLHTRSHTHMPSRARTRALSRSRSLSSHTQCIPLSCSLSRACARSLSLTLSRCLPCILEFSRAPFCRCLRQPYVLIRLFIC